MLLVAFCRLFRQLLLIYTGGHIVNVSSELGLVRNLPDTARRAVTSATSVEDLQRVSYSDADNVRGQLPTLTASCLTAITFPADDSSGCRP